MEPKRPRLSPVPKTVFISDLVDSTEINGHLGDELFAEILRFHDRVARDLVHEHSGQEVDRTDGFLLLFDRPIIAVRYALEFHRKMAELSKDLGLDLFFRVGIHLGEVVPIRTPNRYVARGAKPLELEGLGKPLAARLAGLAVGGQTLLTRAAFDVARQAATRAELLSWTWVSHGPYLLKGIEDPVEVLEVGRAAISPLTPPPDSEKARRVGDDEKEILLLSKPSTPIHHATRDARRKDRAHQPHERGRIRLALIRSGEMDYINDMENGFRSELERQEHAEFIISTCSGPAGPLRSRRWQLCLDWLASCNSTNPFDYYVALGTQASRSVVDWLRANRIEHRGLLFLGVTDPIGQGLVSSLRDREEADEIAGIKYGESPFHLVSLIRQFFPDYHLAFVYRRDVPQDDYIAKELRRHRLFKSGMLSIRATRTKPKIDDFSRHGVLYFSWYTFEQMYQESWGQQLLQQRLVLSTTRRQVDTGQAVAGIGADDCMIGRSGARLLALKERTKNRSLRLGRQSVGIAPLKVWINCERALRERLLVSPRCAERAVLLGDRSSVSRFKDECDRTLDH